MECYLVNQTNNTIRIYKKLEKAKMYFLEIV